MEKKERIIELDFLRGLAVIAMIIDHFTLLVTMSAGYGGFAYYLFGNYQDINNSFLNPIIKFSNVFQNSTFRLVGHYIFVTLFLLLCGISCTFSKNNFKRGLKIIGFGMIITFATVVLSQIVNQEMYIIFGILSTLGCSILIYALIEKIYDYKWIYLSFGLMIILWGFLIHWWNVERIYTIKQLNIANLIQVILGYKLFGEDCFGLLPCCGVVLIGAFIGKTLYIEKKTLFPNNKNKWTIPFNFVGRHALWFYLLHQVVGIIIIVLMYLIVGYRF